MQSWGGQREVEKPTIRQQSVASLPDHQQDAARHATEIASEQYPSVSVADCSLHVCRMGDEWELWLNNQHEDFTGLCAAAAPTREEVIAEAIRVFEAALAELRKPLVAGA